MASKVNGPRLRRELAARGLEQRDLVTLSGVSHATVSRACAGGNVSPTTFAAIARALAREPLLPLADLLGEEEGR